MSELLCLPELLVTIIAAVIGVVAYFFIGAKVTSFVFSKVSNMLYGRLYDKIDRLFHGDEITRKLEENGQKIVDDMLEGIKEKYEEGFVKEMADFEKRWDPILKSIYDDVATKNARIARNKRILAEQIVPREKEIKDFIVLYSEGMTAK